MATDMIQIGGKHLEGFFQLISLEEVFKTVIIFA